MSATKPRSCYRKDGRPKHAWETRKEAKEHADKGKSAYLCPRCRLWHVGRERPFAQVFCSHCGCHSAYQPLDRVFVCFCVQAKFRQLKRDLRSLLASQAGNASTASS